MHEELHPAARRILEVIRDIAPEGQAMEDCYDIRLDDPRDDAPLEVAIRDWRDAGFPMPKGSTNGDS